MRSPATWLARFGLGLAVLKDDLDGVLLGVAAEPDRPWRTSFQRSTDVLVGRAKGGQLARERADEAELDLAAGLGGSADASSWSARAAAVVVVCAGAAAWSWSRPRGGRGGLFGAAARGDQPAEAAGRAHSGAAMPARFRNSRRLMVLSSIAFPSLLGGVAPPAQVSELPSQ